MLPFYESTFDSSHVAILQASTLLYISSERVRSCTQKSDLFPSLLFHLVLPRCAAGYTSFNEVESLIVTGALKQDILQVAHCRSTTVSPEVVGNVPRTKERHLDCKERYRVLDKSPGYNR